MNHLLPILLSEFKEHFDATAKFVSRHVQFPELPNKIKVAIGMRRTGKTSFLFQTIRQLLQDKKIPWTRFLYLNFEDDRLSPCSQQQFRELLEGFYKIYPENHDEVCYFFLDEVQNIEDWALVIRRFFDTKKIQIYLTGSSAKLLSKEIATSLRGRSIPIEIWPYSFQEYLSAQNINLEPGLRGQKTQDILLKHLKLYIAHGGFPETIGTQLIDQRQLLQDYTELVIMRDIVERHSVTNISLLKYLIKTLLKNTAGGFSVHKFANDIKSQGLSGSKNTIYDYLSYIEDAYLAFLLPLYSESMRKMMSNPRKIYAVDSGLVNAFSFGLNQNSGHLFENLIFLDLKRAGHKIHYYLTKERYEIDFLTEDRFGEKHFYQVVWDTSDKKTLEREMRAIKSAENELKIQGKLVTPENYINGVL